MISSETAIALLALCTVGLSFVALAFWQRIKALSQDAAAKQREYERKLAEETARVSKDEKTRAAEALAELNQRHQRELEENKRNALSVVVHPFVTTEGQKGVFSRETRVEIGYKYQLFVQGLPCFEPHTIVLESTSHKEVDERMMQLLQEKATQAAETAVIASSGGTTKAAISIAKVALKVLR